MALVKKYALILFGTGLACWWYWVILEEWYHRKMVKAFCSISATSPLFDCVPPLDYTGIGLRLLMPLFLVAAGLGLWRIKSRLLYKTK